MFSRGFEHMIRHYPRPVEYSDSRQCLKDGLTLALIVQLAERWFDLLDD